MQVHWTRHIDTPGAEGDELYQLWSHLDEVPAAFRDLALEHQRNLMKDNPRALKYFEQCLARGDRVQIMWMGLWRNAKPGGSIEP